MDHYISNVLNYLQLGINEGSSFVFKAQHTRPLNVVLLGLGGSGIGAELVHNYIELECKVPVVICKDYFLPGFVNEHTLVIASSYSGNTEEVLQCVEQAREKNAQLVGITSGGKLQSFAEANQYDCMPLATGIPPRAYVACSFSQILFALKQYGIIGDKFVGELEGSVTFLNQEQAEIKVLASNLAAQLLGKIPVIYCDQRIASIATRWRQQFNENSKILGWERTFPEMNHNELVGWRDVHQDLALIFLHSGMEIAGVKKRFEISAEVAKDYTNTVIDCYAKGETFFDKVLYLALLGDWASWYLAELRGVDAVEVKVIDYLKSSLAGA